jgi:outer membrane protein TolC
LNLQRIQTIVDRGAASKDEVDRASVELEAAKAQVEIKLAEMKEVEVRIKFAKKKLEEAKNNGPRPINPLVPPNPPKFTDPPKLEAIPKPKDPPKVADPPKLEAPKPKIPAI